MKILLVSATVFEIKPLLEKLSFREKKNDLLWSYHYNGHEVDVLVTGIGMVHTAVHLATSLAHQKYDLAINAGICGTFSPDLAIGEVAEVIQEQFSELGVEDKNEFHTLFQLKLMDGNQFPYRNEMLFNFLPIISSILNILPKVNAVTVNTVHGSIASIEKVKARFSPQAESMEGAAFLYTALCAGIPNTQIRAVSNKVEERDKSKWEVQLAIHNLNGILLELIKELTS